MLDAQTVLRGVTVIGEGIPDAYECWIEDGTGLPQFSDPVSVRSRLQARLGTASLESRAAHRADPLEQGDRVDGDWNGMPASGWAFTEGDLRLALVCRSELPPGDRWRSIAETLEALP